MDDSRSAKSEGYITCLSCLAVVEAPAKKCPRCNSRIEYRKSDSLKKTWLLLLTSIFLYFPANLLPITYTSYLFNPVEPGTIMDSIQLLLNNDSVVIALIIFCASIFTPFFKMAVLLYLLLHTQPRKPPIIQTKLYHFIHFIGRWSMIDVFVVSLLGALIRGRLAEVLPGIGIFAFAGVVVFTMIAVETFDIRILWDNYRNYESRNH